MIGRHGEKTLERRFIAALNFIFRWGVLILSSYDGSKKAKTMAITSMPSADVIAQKFSEYVAALGKVAHAWNYLQERLGQLFVAILPTSPHNVLLAIWYSEPNDRAQRRMLRAAINAGALKLHGAAELLPQNANEDILWLLKEADDLSVRRDQAVHAPCMIATGAEGTEMAAAFFHGHPLADQLRGKKLLYEFDLSEWRAEALSRYAMQIENRLMRDGKIPWPDKRPSLSRELHRQQRG